MNKYTITFSEDQMEFIRQLMQSQVPITIQAAKVAASLQDAILGAAPDVAPPST